MLSYQSRFPGDDDDRLLRAAINVAPVAVVLTDAQQPDSPAVYVNREFLRITGYTAEEVLGHNLRMLQGPATDPEVKAALRQALQANRPVHAELLNYRKDGRPFWMRVEITPVFDANGVLVRHLGIMRDVTESHRTAERMREREERLEAIAGAIPLPMLIVDFQGIIEQVNDHAGIAIGNPSLVGRQLKDFIDVGGIWEDVRRTGGVHQVEVQMRTARGELRWVVVSAVRFRVDHRDAAIVAFVDIGEQKCREQELARARDEAERATRAKSRFFAAASHDLRQPLQALALFATALEQHVDTPTAQNIVTSIKLALSTMEEMFDALLDMSRLDAGVLVAQPDVFMVNDVLERLEVEFVPQAERKGLSLRVVPSSAAVESDPALLGRILRNFLSNAVRYTDKGRILLGCKRRGINLMIAVADTGPGIPEDERLNIFEEFFQGSDRPSSSGLGLGLAIVQRLARLLGHRLEVRSQVGRGAMFGIEVPLAEMPEVDVGDDEEGEDLGDLSGSTMLVVDDDPAVRESVQMLLEEWGSAGVTASSGAEALARIEAGLRPDVILADFRLPEEGGGVGAIERMLAALGEPVPAFLFTGDTDMRDGQNNSAGRTYPVLQKPISAIKLRLVLAAALDHQ
jgi:two-component system, sensor histidine kinase